MPNLKTILRYNKWFVCSFVLIFIYVLIFTKVINYQSKYSGNESHLEGTITSLNINGNKLTMHVKAKETVIVNYYLKSELEKNNILNEISLGDTIKLNGSFSKPLKNTIPNTFNYQDYLYKHKIFYTFKAQDYEIKKGHNLFYKVKDLLLKRAYNLDNSDYFLVFILGDKGLLSSEDYQNFQVNGVSHLLAISGMHIGIILFILNKLLQRLSPRKSFIISSLVLLFFAFITSFAASVMRAILFYILNSINKMFDLKFSSMQILFMTAFILVIINPFIIYDLGFIYSFVVCAGIIYYDNFIKGNYFISLLKLSLISFLFSLPISAYTNYEINIMAVFLNLIFVPLISFLVYPMSLITFICPLFNPAFSILLNITAVLNSWFANISCFINIPKIPLYLCFLFWLILLLGKKHKWIYGGLGLIIIVCKIIPLIDGKYQVFYLDVGQGDCAVLISPHHKEVVMIDTGGKISYNGEEWKQSSKSYNLSDNTIKFLKSIGITKINYLIVSHGDADHAQEAINILAKMKVKNVVLNQGKLNKLEKCIKAKAHITDEYQLKDFKIVNLNQKNYGDENANSIINLISFDKYNLLFMGDAGITQENDIIAKYKIPKIDFLKLGHHGSKTSTGINLLENISFSFGIISSGRNNRYNHPSPEVVQSLEKYHKKYYNTQNSGTIAVSFGKNNYMIKTYEP